MLGNYSGSVCVCVIHIAHPALGGTVPNFTTMSHRPTFVNHPDQYRVGRPIFRCKMSHYPAIPRLCPTFFPDLLCTLRHIRTVRGVRSCR